MVREFYANAYLKEKPAIPPYMSYVRGHTIDYSPAMINALFGLQAPEKNEYTAMLSSRWDPDVVREALCLSGAVWGLTAQQRPRFWRHPDFKPIPRTWCSFVQGRLLPVSHFTEVKILQVILVYCIIQQCSIDVGRVIAYNIYHTAQSGSGGLVNLNLITALIRRARIVTPVIQRVRPLPPITASMVRQWIEAIGGEVPGGPAMPPLVPAAEQQMLSYLAQQHLI